ncbi:MAG: cytochrome d ubiquinol oxidase subunit II [Chlamydiia bacterium]|nr:cytochrome d ubiquinol oxidase subunit II [Chlamydiia bacterium]
MYGLEIFWYVIFITAVACYAMLDGFDLGVGMLMPFARKDEDRRLFLNAIGPVWDGNEVWLVIVIGGMFAGFPYAYATLFSAFYIPLVILICALIFRAVAIEFRSKVHHQSWRCIWDYLFFAGSLVITLAIGMALGNLIQGIPLNSDFDYTGDIFMTFFQPYPILVGILAISIFLMHGSIYLVMKTEGEIHDAIVAWIRPSIIFFVISYLVTTLVTLIYQSHMAERLQKIPYLFIIVLVNILAIANIPRETRKGRHGFAFISSCVNIASLMAIYAVGNFPHLIRSSVNPATNSLTISNSSASAYTLIVLAVIVAIGLPLVISYGYYIYRVFRGKVKIGPMSY